MALKHADPAKLNREETEETVAKRALEAIAARRRQGRRGPHGGGPAGRMFAGEKAKDLKGTIRKMLALMARFKIRLIIIFIFAIGSTIFTIVGPKVLSEATTQLFNGIVAEVAGTGSINFEAIGIILLVTLLLYVASAICSFVQGWVMTYVSQKTCYDLRDAIAKKIDRMPFRFFDSTSTGDTLSRITNDVDTLGQSLNQGITQFVTSVTTLEGVLIMMFSINWIMTLITLVMIPIAAGLMMVIVKHSQKYFFQQQATLGAINGQVEETFSGHAVVKAFNKEEETLRVFNETNAKLYECGWKAQFLSGLMQPLMNFVGNLGYVAVAISGSFFAVAGAITVGDIQAFVQYVRNFTQPITQLAQIGNVLQQMAAAAERIFEFLEEPEESPDDPLYDTDGIEGTVDFEHVRFGYDPETPIINDFTAHIQAGQTVAIVGPTGAGKTTLVKLLMRFYDVQGGSIKIGGHDVREYTRQDVRGMFGMVLQDTWLFSGSIMDNIRYGKLDASDAEVKAVARRTWLHHFIQTLPGGYDFQINEDANNISQGQRQLLTIARVLLADRRMLILDEATSSVDTRTEQRIQRAMGTLMQGRTSFVIAHRLSTIRAADLILVMNHGDIVEQGTHEELLSLGGFYADLYNSQFVECNDKYENEQG